MRKKLKLWPLNDFVHLVHLKTVVDGEVVPLTAGVVNGFLATTKTDIAEAAHPSLTDALAHQGNGAWEVRLDGDALTSAVLDAAFPPGTKMYLIVVQTGGIRSWWEVIYEKDREGALA